MSGTRYIDTAWPERWVWWALKLRRKPYPLWIIRLPWMRKFFITPEDQERVRVEANRLAAALGIDEWGTPPDTTGTASKQSHSEAL